jgi:hypothetical protein
MRGTSSAGASDLERLSSAGRGGGGALLQEVESRRFRERWLRKRSAQVASMLQSYRLEATALGPFQTMMFVVSLLFQVA